MSLSDSISDLQKFNETLNKLVLLDKKTYTALINSSPNFNLLYSNVSSKYQEPFEDITLFLPVEIPEDLFNFLYGSDLDVSKQELLTNITYTCLILVYYIHLEAWAAW
jgi:hypothetical protein